MPNVVKYGTSISSNSIKRNNVVVGVNDVNYGPTSTTGFFLGITPPASGYTVYRVLSDNSNLSIDCPANDTAMINLAKSLGGSNINTIGDALIYISTGKTDTIVVNKDYPNIVTNGLIFLMDANYIPSYPTTGSNWYDISQSGRTGTLLNGPTYLSGSIVLDGTNDYISTNFSYSVYNSGTTLPITMEFTIQQDILDVQNANGAVFSDSGWLMFCWAQKILTGGSIKTRFVCGTGGVGASEIEYYSTQVDRYRHYTMTLDSSNLAKLYIDGAYVTQKSMTVTQYAAFRTLYLGSDRGTSTLLARFTNLKIYNRDLSSTEILQNYYQGNIVTSGLTLMLDGANMISYGGTGTTVYDMTSNVFNGTLTNGPVYNMNGVGRFILDGSNDYINIPYNTSLDLPTARTTSVWVKLNSKTVFQTIIGQANTGANQRKWDVRYGAASGSDNKIRVVLGQGGPQASVDTTLAYDLTTKWYNLVVGYDGATTTCNIYIDGVLAGSSSSVYSTLYSSVANGDSTLGFNVGQRQGGANPTNGSVSTFMIYNRMLSAQEVAQNYNAHKGRFGL